MSTPQKPPADESPSDVVQQQADAGQSAEAVAESAPTSQPAGRGMFGVSGSGDTSGYGGLVRRRAAVLQTEPPYGGYFDEVVDALREAVAAGAEVSTGEPGLEDPIEQVIVDRGELTLHVKADRIAEVCQVMRDDPSLRFELCSSVSGVDYIGEADETGRRLHVVYHLTSMTFRRRVRLEAAVTVDNPRLPSVAAIYPTADWQEREAYDMFGVIFEGHPNLTRILMPDDWEGYPQRKDYPLGGVPVEYKGAEIPPPDERRAYK